MQDNRHNFAPAKVLRLVFSYGQDPNHGMSRRDQRLWRYRWQLTGPERVEVGQACQDRLRELGYDADVSFWAGSHRVSLRA